MRLLIAFFCLTPALLYAQPEIGLRVAVDESGAVFIYHNQLMTVGSGFNIYRADANTRNFVKLNGDTPVTGVTSAEMLPRWLVQNYDAVRNGLNESDPITIMARLRSDTVTRNMYAFLYPDLAFALGQLYVDTTAVLGKTVSYKIEKVSPTGVVSTQELSTTVTLRPEQPVPPIDVQLKQEGRAVTVTWKYPLASATDDDKVIQFYIYRLKEAASDAYERINYGTIIRDANKNAYEYTYVLNQVEGDEKVFVVPVMITGRGGQRSAMRSLALKDNQAPPVPTGIVATPIAKTIQVSWDASPANDIAGYNVWRKDRADGDLRKLNTTLIDPLNTLYIDGTVVGGSNFYYAVSAVDRSGNESESSAPNAARPPDTTPPPAPRNLKAVLQADKSIRLTWEGQINDDLKSYLVLRRFTQHQDERAFLQLNETVTRSQSWIDTDLQLKQIQEGGNYIYAIVAQDEAKNISDTTFAVFKMPDFTPPTAPYQVFGENDRGFRVRVSWSASPSVDVVRYQLRRIGIDGSASADFGDIPRSATLQFWDETVEPTRKYFYQVIAVDSLSNASEATLSDTVWVRDTNAPREVRNVRANRQGNGSVLVTWEPIVADDLQEYRVYRCPRISTGVYQQVGVVNKNTLQWTDGNYEPQMWYLVTAVDASGNESRRSEPIEVYSKE